jgi:hypothetical protein
MRPSSYELSSIKKAPNFHLETEDFRQSLLENTKISSETFKETEISLLES